MAEILLYARDDPALEPSLSKQTLANRFKRFDVVSVNPDGFAWGEQELKNPAFRILVWPGKAASVFDQFLGPQLATLDSITRLEKTYLQPRAMMLNLNDARVSSHPALSAWWLDGTRTIQKIQLPAAIASVIIPSDLVAPRPIVTAQ